MNEKIFDVNSLWVASPCSVGWENMAGDDRARHCSLCSLNVYNVSALSAAEVHNLIATREERICVRMYRRADGTVLTKDCPVGFGAYQKRMTRFAGATLTAILGLFSVTFAQKEENTSIDAAKSKIVKINDLVGEYNLKGSVTDAAGAVVPNTTILLYKKDEKIPITIKSDDNGSYGFKGISAGIYRIEVPANYGFLKVRIENIQIQNGKSTEINLQLSAAAGTELMGVVGETPMIDMTIAGPTPTVITNTIPRRPFD